MGKFIIVRGRVLEIEFVIKQPNSTTALPLDPKDSGTFTLSTIGPNPRILIDRVRMNQVAGKAGTFKLRLDQVQTENLPYDEEFGEDNYPLVATCKGLLDITSAAEGKIYGDIQNVYVQNVGD